MASAIVSAIAALAGVFLAQILGWVQRRAEDRRRRRSEVAATVAPTLSLILEATEQIRRGVRTETAWHQQAAWGELTKSTWPPVRTLLLNQAAQEPTSSEPSFYGVTLRLQELLASEERNADEAFRVWDSVRRQVLDLRDREMGRK